MIMDAVLKPPSTAGACISILFSFSTVGVLACFRNKSRSILIKQQFALSVMVTNTIMVAGLQGGLSRLTCRVVTILLLYSVVASFAWLVKDIAYIVTCINGKLPLQDFRLVCLCVWGMPIPCLGLAVLLGEVVKSNMGLQVYSCWVSDHFAWAWIVPCFLLILISAYCIGVVIKTLLKIKRNKQDVLQIIYMPEDAIKYNLTRNVTMLILNIIVWIISALVFLFPSKYRLQLLLGLSNATQGLLLFFLCCIFHTREKEIYNLREVNIPGRLNPTAVKTPAITEENIDQAYTITKTIEPLPQTSTESIETKNVDDLRTTVESDVDEVVSSRIPNKIITPIEVSNTSEALTVRKEQCHTYKHINNFEDFINASMPSNSNWRFRNNTHPDVDEKEIENTSCIQKISHLKNIDTQVEGEGTHTSTGSTLSGAGVAKSRCSSRNSAASFTSMNELETLFNNPDLMNAAYIRKSRFPGQQVLINLRRVEVSTAPSDDANNVSSPNKISVVEENPQLETNETTIEIEENK